MKRLRFLLLAILLPPASSALAGGAAAAPQSHAEIHRVAEAFVRAQTAGLPGDVSIKVDEIDRRVTRPACPNLEAFLPPGARLLGNSMVGVRCLAEKGWSLFIPVHVRVTAEMLVSSRPLRQGETLHTEDLSTLRGEITQPGILTDPAKAVGQVLKFGLAAGQVLKQDMLRPPYAITQGQAVHLRAGGAGFSIRTEGEALGNAAEGEPVRVKTASGKVVSGTARPDGVVEIRP